MDSISLRVFFAVFSVEGIEITVQRALAQRMFMLDKTERWWILDPVPIIHDIIVRCRLVLSMQRLEFIMLGCHWLLSFCRGVVISSRFVQMMCETRMLPFQSSLCCRCCRGKSFIVKWWEMNHFAFSLSLSLSVCDDALMPIAWRKT
jgi:hypothetical protein